MQFTTFSPLFWLLLTLPPLLLGLWATLVDRPRGKLISSFALRCLAVLFLVLALCRPFLTSPGDRMHVAFLLDVSASVDLDSAQAAAEQVQRTIEQLEPGDSWSLAIAGRELRVVENIESLNHTLEQWRGGASDDAFRGASRLAEAMLTMRAMFPSGKAKRIVLLSDGRPTGASVGEAIAQLTRERVDVHFGPIDGLRQPESAVVLLQSSSRRAFKDEIVRLTVEVAANIAMAGQVRIANRGVIVQQKPVQLSPTAPVRVHFDVPMTSVGAAVWTAELLTPQDHFPINNAMSCTIEVVGEPRILVLHEKPAMMRDMARSLQQQGFEIDVRPPLGMPSRIDDLLAFDAVMLASIAASDLQPRQMTMLKQYVSDFGGGLMMMGSENSFGLGGYYRTPVEEVLPLVSRFEKEKEKPSLAMVLVIDKSGSMQGMPIALARQASKAAVELLSPQDQIGVVGFDGQAFILADIQSAGNRDAVNAAIDQLAASGGTFMHAGMDAARQMLERTVAQIKHMIVLGDGMSAAADHEGLASQLADMGVNVSTVALGPGADRPLMQRIAEIGRGRYYETMDPATVPQIFTRETMQASRSAIKEDLYAGVQVADHPLLLGFEQVQLPLSLGFVMTQPKATARVLLATETGDPLLAFSRYGLGSSLAFTSDLTPQWGAEWLAWPQFGKFWSQALRAIVRQGDNDGLRIEQSSDDRTLTFDIHAASPDARPLDGLQFDAQMLDDGGRTHPVAIEQIGLGHYVARVPIHEQRVTTLRLHDTDRDKLRVMHHHRPYDLEYRLAGGVAEELQSLPRFAEAGIRQGIVPVDRRRRIEFGFILAAMTSMLAGLILRRI